MDECGEGCDCCADLGRPKLAKRRVAKAREGSWAGKVVGHEAEPPLRFQRVPPSPTTNGDPYGHTHNHSQSFTIIHNHSQSSMPPGTVIHIDKQSCPSYGRHATRGYADQTNPSAIPPTTAADFPTPWPHPISLPSTDCSHSP